MKKRLPEWARCGPGSDPSTPDFNKTAMLKWILNHEEVTTIITGVTTCGV